MVKLKVKEKGYQLVVKAKFPWKRVNTNSQYEVFLKDNMCGFMNLSSIKRNQIEFIGPVGISLHERLKKMILKHDFFFIIEQIVYVTQILKEKKLSFKNLVLDLKYVFFNESTKELHFIYLPMPNLQRDVNIITFIESIIYLAKPVIEEDNDYISKFAYFIKKINGYHAEEIENYIIKIDEDIVNTIRKVHINRKSFIDDEFKDDRNSKLKQSNKNVEMELLDEEKTALFDEDDEQTALFDENVYLSDDDATVLLFEDEDDKTSLFNANQDILNQFPTLTRKFTDEIIRIDKPVFRIGKEENCVDYVVTNNNTVSRSHADIISRGGKYFVFDLRSKNKSYINNRVLPAEHEIEIFDGDILKLANEEFLFKV